MLRLSKTCLINIYLHGETFGICAETIIENLEPLFEITGSNKGQFYSDVFNGALQPNSIIHSETQYIESNLERLLTCIANNIEHLSPEQVRKFDETPRYDMSAYPASQQRLHDLLRTTLANFPQPNFQARPENRLPLASASTTISPPAPSPVRMTWGTSDRFHFGNEVTLGALFAKKGIDGKNQDLYTILGIIYNTTTLIMVPESFFYNSKNLERSAMEVFKECAVNWYWKKTGKELNRQGDFFSHFSLFSVSCAVNLSRGGKFSDELYTYVTLHHQDKIEQKITESTHSAQFQKFLKITDQLPPELQIKIVNDHTGAHEGYAVSEPALLKCSATIFYDVSDRPAKTIVMQVLEVNFDEAQYRSAGQGLSPLVQNFLCRLSRYDHPIRNAMVAMLNEQLAHYRGSDGNILLDHFINDMELTLQLSDTGFQTSTQYLKTMRHLNLAPDAMPVANEGP